MFLKKFNQPRTILISEIVNAIKKFEAEGKNPHGPNKADPSHCAVMMELRYGGPPIKKEGEKYAQDPCEEFALNPEERDEEDKKFLDGAGIITKHKVLYPMTKAYISRQWHRAYAFDVETKEVTEVRLLVAERQDPTYKEQGYKSAHEWTIALKKETTPVFEEIYTAKELEDINKNQRRDSELTL